MSAQSPWLIESRPLEGQEGHLYTLTRGQVPVTFEEVLELWRLKPAFRRVFSTALAESPYPAFRWETPPVTSANLTQPFRWVLLRQDALERPLDQDSFAGHFNPTKPVISFYNLGRDARLVVPCPQGPLSAYGHLAAFLREAPEAQVHALWRSVAEAMDHRVGARPVWLSTAGMGVSWLHIRLDDRPKYYGYGPFRQIPRP